MSASFIPRPAQARILAYRGGLMAVSAVPGSGKTRTIAALAAELVAEGALVVEGATATEARVLVVTYQNAAANALSARIAAALTARGLPTRGFEVRTLHSLAHGILVEQAGLSGLVPSFGVADAALQSEIMSHAIAAWRAGHPEDWSALHEQGKRHALPGQKPRIGSMLENLGRSLVSSAKNQGLGPSELRAMLEPASGDPAGDPAEASPFLRLGASLYADYQQRLERAGLVDFDDLVRLSVELLDSQPELAASLGRRWPFILEDEAQDSVPLQEALLERLGNAAGRCNWVRVGDPNQAITSSFTAADPGSLRRFLARAEVEAVTMQQSGRSAETILNLANHLVDWTADAASLPELRDSTFVPQHILPTSAGDPQPNPPAEQSRIAFRVYRERDAELEDTIRRAMAVAERRPELSLAILVSTNALGARVARRLQGLGARFDERLRGTAASRQVIALLAEALGLLADPLRRERYAMLFDTLRPLLPADDPMVLADPEALRPLLRSCQPEILLYPTEEQGMRDALPPVAKLPDSLVAAAESLAVLCRRWMRARDLPVDQLILTIASDLLSETDMATAGRIASAIRMRAESNPERLLPALAGDLAELARSRTGIWSEEDELPFEPRPGVITLTTMHKAKGMEWDLVYLCGVDGEWFPSGLDDRFVGAWNWLGGDPIEEARSELLARLGRARHPGRSATEAAHIDLIAERMRLLYVGITRAKLWLSISWSQGVQRPQGTPRALPMSEAWRELKRFHESE